MAFQEQAGGTRWDAGSGHDATILLSKGDAGVPLHGAFLSVRLWRSGAGREAEELRWDSESPAVCLATDLLTASEGAEVSSQGAILVTGFRGIQAAMSAARRLQWAIQGLAEARDLRGIAASILVYSADDLRVEPGGIGLEQSLERAKPGHILVTAAAGKAVEALPGLPLRKRADSGLQELLWRPPEKESTRAFDEEVVTQLLSQQGLVDDLDEGPAGIEPIGGDLAPSKPGSVQDSTQSGWSRDRLRWLIGGAVAAALLLIVALIFHLKSGTPHEAESKSATVAGNVPAADTPVTPAAAAVKADSQPAGDSSPKKLTAAEARKADREAKESGDKKKTPVVAENSVVPPPQPSLPPPEKPKGSRCDLDPSMYASALEQAQHSFERNDYKAAERQFYSVYACEPGNARAKEGLERVKRAREQEN